MLTRTENSAFIVTGALSPIHGMPSLISERDIRSGQGADNYFTPAQDLGFLRNTVADVLSRDSIPRNSTSRNSVTQDEFQAIQQAASAVLTQNSLMLNPQNVPLLEELSLDKLKKFELATITLPYTSDMLLCRIPAYVKSTIVDG